jgi:2-keto-3-deoxy-L-rhamnonate aldolase RhmA
MTTNSPLNLNNSLLTKMRAGGLGICMIVKQMRSVEIAVAAKSCDFDAIYVDLEHSVISESDAAQICVASLLAGITPLVRVPSHDSHYAARILDAGAMGVVVPHVNTADEARAIVSACKFAPLGERSVASSWPHMGYQSFPPDEIRRAFNQQTLVAVMLETPEAVANADAIAAVEGVDLLHIGSTDLCDAMGIPGQFSHPDVEKAFAKVIEACRRHGKIAGVGGMGTEPETTKKILRMGVRFVTAGNDWGFMMAAARQRASMLRQLPLE